MTSRKFKCGCLKKIDYYDKEFNLSCNRVWEVIKRSAFGVFQLEGHSAKKWIDDFNINSVEEISNFTALIRPGPLESGMTESYVSVSKGGDTTIDIPEVKDVLAKTKGCLFFQEQVMEICRKVASMDMKQADMVRRAIGKKLPEELEKMRKVFVSGAVSNNVTEERANEIFDIIDKYSSYSFNKSLVYNTLVCIYDKRTGKFLRDEKISNIKVGDVVLSRDEVTNQKCSVKVIGVHNHGVLPVKKVSFTNGNVVRCTPTHKFRCVNGDMLPVATIASRGLEVVGCGKISSILDFGKHLTFDIEVDHPSHQFYLANGALTSNSHSVAYAHLAYYTAWCKAHYPLEFYLALLKNSGIRNTEQTEEVNAIINDAKLFGIDVVGPSLKRGNLDFEIVDNKTIGFGLSHIKGIGASQTKELSKLIFSSEEAIVHEILCGNIRKNVLAALLWTGALDYIIRSRRGLWNKYVLISSLTKKELDAIVSSNLTMIGVLGDFATLEKERNKSLYGMCPNVSRRKKISNLLLEYNRAKKNDSIVERLMKERFYMGVSFSGKETEPYESDRYHNCREVFEEVSGAYVKILAMIDSVREHVDKNGNRMAFLKISDSTYALDSVVVFASTYRKVSELLQTDNILVFNGKKQGKSFLVNRISTV